MENSFYPLGLGFCCGKNTYKNVNHEHLFPSIFQKCSKLLILSRWSDRSGYCVPSSFLAKTSMDKLPPLSYPDVYKKCIWWKTGQPFYSEELVTLAEAFTLTVLFHWALRRPHSTVQWSHAHALHLAKVHLVPHSFLMHTFHGLKPHNQYCDYQIYYC